jgi:hypothetical protein
MTEPRSSLNVSAASVPPVLPVGGVSSDLGLETLIHYAFQAEHPEWVEPSGESPMCDLYEAPLAELLGIERRRRG